MPPARILTRSAIIKTTTPVSNDSTHELSERGRNLTHWLEVEAGLLVRWRARLQGVLAGREPCLYPVDPKFEFVEPMLSGQGPGSRQQFSCSSCVPKAG